MGIFFKPGKTIHGYEIVREMNRGGFAASYEARAPTGERVFFKQYFSPTKLVDWYDGFVDHQKKIKRRIESDPAARDRCYRFVEFFEESAYFFQVFEFVEGGNDLKKFLAGKGSLSWQQSVTFAKVMMFGIKALHQVKIVHTDLKPDNVFLIPDSDIGIGFKLRIIDLDWAIFTDRPAPWHGRQGYIGTPAYQSPEHLAGTVPVPASDIFTCGIILGEILGADHPFAGAGADGYDAVRRGEFQRIALRQPIERVDNQAFLESVLNSCLNPDPGGRPTAAQVCEALIGKTFPWHAYAPKAEIPAARSTPGRTPPRDPVLTGPDTTPAVRQNVEIRYNGSHVTTVSTDAEFGRQYFKALHTDAQFLSNPQFNLRRRDTGWIIEHCPSATNETLVDGGKLMAPVPVRDGMRVAVGSSAKGIEKLPLEFKLVRS